MRFVIRYSPGVNAAYLRIGGDHRVITRTVTVGSDDNVMIDLDQNGQVLGIELLSVEAPSVVVLGEDDIKPVRIVPVQDDLL